jgi:putative SOS response-associated peptidase YedK
MMCGRFTLAIDISFVLSRFNITGKFNVEEYMLRYNIAPSQPVLSIIHDGKENRAGFLTWGLVPPWSKDPKIGYKMINARSETLAEKPSFNTAFKKRRCLIIADSFYEWKRNGKNKIPIRIRMKNQEPFAMAGLWERWQSPSGQEITSCTIITTIPNELMSSIHDRMPVIIKKEDEQTWLDRSVEDTDYLSRFLVPYDQNMMETYEVSTAVNSPKHDSIELTRPVTA